MAPEDVAANGLPLNDAFWEGEFKKPPLTGADLEFEQRQQAFRDEAEAQKTPEEREADAAAEEATKNADAALVAEKCGGVARRPGGTWKTAAEHRAAAEKHWTRAYGLRCVSDRRRLHAHRPFTSAPRGILRRSVSVRRNPRTQRRRARAPSSKEGSDDHVVPAALVRAFSHEQRRLAASRLRGVA